MEPTLQGLGPAPQPMVGGAPQMQPQGALGQPQAASQGAPQGQPQINPQMLMMIRQHVMRQALMQNAIAKAKQAGLRDAARKEAMTRKADNPNDVLGQAVPNDPQFGTSNEVNSGGYSGMSNNPGR